MMDEKTILKEAEHNEIKKDKLEVPKNEFNPRMTEIDPNDERFFAFESQKSHH